MDKWDSRFLELAKMISSFSKDPSTQTGAVIVRPDRTIQATGYNGFPKGMPDTPELLNNREEKYSRIVHCEINALLTARDSVKGSTLYTYPFLSCDRCCVQMLQAGIIRFVAPKATLEQAVRWEQSFKRTRQYCRELGVEVLEV